MGGVTTTVGHTYCGGAGAQATNVVGGGLAMAARHKLAARRGNNFLPSGLSLGCHRRAFGIGIYSWVAVLALRMIWEDFSDRE